VTENEGAGIRAVAGRLGWATTPEVFAASESALLRGHHLALVASEGSGVEAVYAAAALSTEENDPAEDAGSVRALVLCPTDERAARVARSVSRAIGPDEGGIFLVGGGMEADSVPAGTRIVVSRPSRVLPAIRSGRFGTGGLGLLVLDGVSDLEQLDEWSSVEPLLDAVGSEVRKVAVTGRPNDAFRQLLDRQLPRARRWPEELLPVAGSDSEASGEHVSESPLRVAVGPGSEWLSLLDACIAEAGTADGAIRVTCADPDDVDEVAAALAVGGHSVTREGPEIRLEPCATEVGARAGIWFGAPLDLSDFEKALTGTEHRFVIIDPARLHHVETLARRAGMPVTPAGGAPLTDPLDAVVNYRRRLEDAVRSADYVPELLVLEPLIARYGAARVAAGLSALHRRRDDEAGAIVPWPDIEAASLAGIAAPPGSGRDRDVSSQLRKRSDTGAGGERRPGTTPRGARSAWTKLYFGIGRKDDIKPGDLVGAITGETGIVGGQIGKIDIRGGFSLVEVDSQVVDDVLRRLQGVTIRGQDVPVRPDRER
jgi:ATP-dependent RNA helicase DeaD